MTQGFTVEARTWVVEHAPVRGWGPFGTNESEFRVLLERAVVLAVAEGTGQVELRHMEAADTAPAG